MKIVFKIITLIFLAIALAQLSCQKELSCENCAAGKPPIAIAGKDTTIILPTDSLFIDGSVSFDPDGTIKSYEWRKIAGPASFNIVSATTAKTIVKKLSAGVYQFELKVTDNSTLSAKDTLMVIVSDPLHPNHPPVANAGKDTTITLPNNSVTLDGNGTFDPDNNIIAYNWTQISGPPALNIANANAVQTQVSYLAEGIYNFELKVTDAGGLFSKDTVLVIVNNNLPAVCGAVSQMKIGTLSIPRYSTSLLAAGNKIVFAGGYLSGVGFPSYGASPRVDIYDRVTQLWSTANLSSTRYDFAPIALDNKMYFAGGDDNNSQPSSRVDIYDAVTSSWSTSELSEARNGIVAVAAGNKIVFAGGFANSGISKKVDIYNQSTATWSTATLSHAISGSYPYNYDIASTGVIAVGNKIYFISSSNTIDIYDTQADTWMVQTVSSNQLGGGGPLSIYDKIYFPGYIHTNTLPNYPNILQQYDILNNTWLSINMLQPRLDMATAAADNKIFWAGGFDSTWDAGSEYFVRPVNNIEIYDIVTGAHTLHNLAQSGDPIRSLTTAKNIFFTTYSSTGETAITDIYNIPTHSWSTCTNDFTQSIAIGNTIYQLKRDNTNVIKLEY